MKNLLPLLALLATPHFALAQTMSSPPTAPAPTAEKPKATDLPDAQQLLDHLFAPYEAAKTYRGTFDIDLESKDPKQPSPFSGLRIETLYRFNANGDKSGEVTTLRVLENSVGKLTTQSLRFVDDGKSAYLVYPEQKAWHPIERDLTPALRSLLQPLLEQSAYFIEQDPHFHLAISRGADAGRKVWILGDGGNEGDGQFHIVVDATTRALRSLRLSGDKGSVSIRGSNQAFEPTVSDNDFRWTPPAGFHQVKEGSIPLPSFLKLPKPLIPPHN